MNLRKTPKIPKNNHETNIKNCNHDFKETNRDSHKTYYKCSKCNMTTEV